MPPFQALVERGFQVDFRSHAKAILTGDFADAVGQLEGVLAEIQIPIEEIIGSGGGEAKVTQRLRRALQAAGWAKVNFEIEKIINGTRRESQSHEVDHACQFPNGMIALEIEWNNKDPFFDRDLENFKRLHSEGAISLGIVITRGTSLQSEMTSMVRRFAQEHNLGSIDDLARVGVRPTPRQREILNRRQ